MASFGEGEGAMVYTVSWKLGRSIRRTPRLGKKGDTALGQKTKTSHQNARKIGRMNSRGAAKNAL